MDESDGCGGKFSAVIVSSQFEGKSLLQKHRLVRFFNFFVIVIGVPWLSTFHANGHSVNDSSSGAYGTFIQLVIR